MEAIGRFVVLERLGVGAHAAVYRAEDPVLDQLVAIKVLATHVAFDPDGRERFIREARLMRRIDSPRTASVYDVAQLPDGRPYLVLELAERGTLEGRIDAVLRDRLPVGLPDVRAVAVALGQSLMTVHDRGVVHRDIKPSNILIRAAAPGVEPDGIAGGVLLRDDDFLLLGDFGLAKALESTRRVTAAVGTPAYMAPEQAAVGAPLDGRADIFAASAVLAELLELVAAPRHPRVAVEIERGMARNRDDRHPDAATWARDVVSALDAHLEPATVLHPVAPVRAPTLPPAAAPPVLQPVLPAPAGVPVLDYHPARRFSFPGGPVLLAVLVAALIAVLVVVLVAVEATGGTR